MNIPLAMAKMSYTRINDHLCNNYCEAASSGILNSASETYTSVGQHLDVIVDKIVLLNGTMIKWRR